MDAKKSSLNDNLEQKLRFRENLHRVATNAELDSHSLKLLIEVVESLHEMVSSSSITKGDTDSRGCFVLFSTTSSWLSRSIRWATQSAVSHVSIAFECATTGRVLVMEAAGGGFRGITWERWQRENEIIRIFRIDVPTQQWQEGLGEFCDTLGCPYDTPRLFREAARHLTQGWTQQFTWANSQTNAKGVLCADAVAVFLHRIGFAQFEFPLRWTPEALLEYAKREQAFVPMTSRVRTMPFLPASNENANSKPAANPKTSIPRLEIVS